MRGQSAVGTFRHLVTVQGSTRMVDGDGGYVDTWANLVPPTWYCSIVPATARDLERVTAGTVIATASHIITGRYHPQIDTASRLVFEGRVFQVTGVSDPEERHIETIAVCVELLDAAPVLESSWMESGWAE